MLEKTETPPPEEFSIAGGKYALLHAQLLAMGLVTWSLTENIPDKCALPVTWMLANLLTSVFAVPQDRKQELLALGALGAPDLSLGEKQLRMALARPYVPQSAMTDYY